MRTFVQMKLSHQLCKTSSEIAPLCQGGHTFCRSLQISVLVAQPLEFPPSTGTLYIYTETVWPSQRLAYLFRAVKPLQRLHTSCRGLYTFGRPIQGLHTSVEVCTSLEVTHFYRDCTTYVKVPNLCRGCIPICKCRQTSEELCTPSRSPHLCKACWPSAEVYTFPANVCVLH